MGPFGILMKPMRFHLKEGKDQCLFVHKHKTFGDFADTLKVIREFLRVKNSLVKSRREPPRDSTNMLFN